MGTPFPPDTGWVKTALPDPGTAEKERAAKTQEEGTSGVHFLSLFCPHNIQQAALPCKAEFLTPWEGEQFILRFPAMVGNSDLIQ